jgi:hypothetical protein
MQIVDAQASTVYTCVVLGTACCQTRRQLTTRQVLVYDRVDILHPVFASRHDSAVTALTASGLNRLPDGRIRTKKKQLYDGDRRWRGSFLQRPRG